MDPREKKPMATQKVHAKGLHICKKCGSVMITRIISEKNGSSKKITAKFIKIQQCIVCRFWRELPNSSS